MLCAAGVGSSCCPDKLSLLAFRCGGVSCSMQSVRRRIFVVSQCLYQPSVGLVRLNNTM